MENVVISIGMPVYNDKKFLHEALDALLNQTFKDFILIISDDCSNDGSSEICKDYEKKDPRIKYIRQPKNIGISRNMKFLLQLAQTEFFIWAANDDIWHPEFLKILHTGLKAKPKALVSFSPYCFINEAGKRLNEPRPRFTDYSGDSALIRLKKLIQIYDDGFGYGLFKRSEILEVEFPTWWWINKQCAYNNIYPALVHYLSKGDYVLCGNEPLWFNRLKNDENINHKIPFPKSYLRGTFAFVLRKFNLAWVSSQTVIKANKDIWLWINIIPLFFYQWALKPSLSYIYSQTKRLIKKELNFF